MSKAQTKNGNVMLKGMGAIFVLYSVLTLICTLTGAIDVGTGTKLTVAVIMIASEFVTGFIGMLSAGKLEKDRVCLLLAILVALVTIVFTVIVGTSRFIPFNFLIALLYAVGAIENQKENKPQTAK